MTCTILTLAMGRKRNKGKARRAAKAKAREEEEAERRGGDDDYQTTNPCEQSLLNELLLQSKVQYSRWKSGTQQNKVLQSMPVYNLLLP